MSKTDRAHMEGIAVAKSVDGEVVGRDAEMHAVKTVLSGKSRQRWPTSAGNPGGGTCSCLYPRSAKLGSFGLSGFRLCAQQPPSSSRTGTVVAARSVAILAFVQ